MAQVTHEIIARVDSHLDYLVGEWEDVPNVAEEWETWDAVERVHYRIDWPVAEERLRDLQGYVEQGLLTPTQQERYAQLLDMVARYRPLLDRLMAD